MKWRKTINAVVKIADKMHGWVTGKWEEGRSKREEVRVKR
jgi:hypothetical protein